MGSTLFFASGSLITMVPSHVNFSPNGPRKQEVAQESPMQLYRNGQYPLYHVPPERQDLSSAEKALIQRVAAFAPLYLITRFDVSLR